MAKDKRSAAVSYALAAAKTAAALDRTGIGGLLTSLVGDCLSEMWQRRTDDVVARLESELRRLESQLNKDRLRSESFNITLVRVLRDSVLEQHEEKQEAFRNILLNDAIAASQNDETSLFVKITEDLTHEHIQVLKILRDPGKVYNTNPAVRHHIDSITSTNRVAPGSADLASALLAPALPGIPSDHWLVLLEGLARYGLIHDQGKTWGGWQAQQPQPQHLLRERTTPLGERYVQSITIRS